MGSGEIQWHPGFVAAMNLELEENRSDLAYEKEYNLNDMPIKIDLLITKENDGAEIVSKIGKIFRKYNIVEFKSPQDHLDIDTFYKSGAYASLYKAYGETVDGRKAKDITVSIIRESKPKGLFRYFEENGVAVENPYRGIYYVSGEVLFKTQIVVTRELEKDNEGWLRFLSGRMAKQEMKELLERVGTIGQKFDKELADAVLEVSIRANWEILEELRGEQDMEALLEFMKPEIDKIVEEEGQKRENRGKILGTVETLRLLGHENAEIADFIVKKFHLKEGDVASYL